MLVFPLLGFLVLSCPLAATEGFQAQALRADELAGIQATLAELERLMCSNGEALPARVQDFVTRHVRGKSEKHRGEVEEALTAELRKNQYRTFTVRKIRLAQRITPTWFRCVAEIEFEIIPREGLAAPTPEGLRPPPMAGVRQEFFDLQQENDGRYTLIDTPIWQIVGRERGHQMVAYSILALMAALCGLAFYIAMGIAVMNRRPRIYLWRWVVVLLPVLGALVYFLAVHLPEARARKAA